MYRQLAGAPQLPHGGSSIPDIARSGQLDALIALERIGTRLRFSRNQEIYGQGESGGFWYKVISGTVRISKLRTDGRRHIAEFCFSGDGFGLESGAERSFSAEAVEDVTVMRYPRVATERLSEEHPAVARLLRDMTLKSLAAAQGRLMILARMTATERVSAFDHAARPFRPGGDRRRLKDPLSAAEQGIGAQQKLGDDQQHDIPFDAQAASSLH